MTNHLCVGIDSNLPDNFGRSVIFGLSALTSIITVSTVGGAPFILAAVLLGTVYYNGKLAHTMLDHTSFIK